MYLVRVSSVGEMMFVVVVESVVVSVLDQVVEDTKTVDNLKKEKALPDVETSVVDIYWLMLLTRLLMEDDLWGPLRRKEEAHHEPL